MKRPPGIPEAAMILFAAIMSLHKAMLETNDLWKLIEFLIGYVAICIALYIAKPQP